jgi:hypothetical protein
MRTFKIKAAKYIIVSWNYSHLELPGTKGKLVQQYWVVVKSFEKDQLELALSKFATEAAALPFSEFIQVLDVGHKDIKEGQYRL